MVHRTTSGALSPRVQALARRREAESVSTRSSPWWGGAKFVKEPGGEKTVWAIKGCNRGESEELYERKKAAAGGEWQAYSLKKKRKERRLYTSGFKENRQTFFRGMCGGVLRRSDHVWKQRGHFLLKIFYCSDRARRFRPARAPKLKDTPNDTSQGKKLAGPEGQDGET